MRLPPSVACATAAAAAATPSTLPQPAAPSERPSLGRANTAPDLDAAAAGGRGDAGAGAGSFSSPGRRKRIAKETKEAATKALNLAMREHSAESALVMTNLPLPKGEGDEAADVYMNHLELLASGIPRAIFVAGQRDAEVITMYS